MEFNFSDHEDNENVYSASYDFENVYNNTMSTVFAIDMHALDFHNGNSGSNNFICVLEAYLDLMSSKALTNPKDTYGLIFYNLVSLSEAGEIHI